MAEAVTVLVAVTSVLAQKSVDALKAMVYRTIAAVKRITGSGTPDQRAARARERPEDKSVSTWAVLQAYALMAVAGLGYLALTWSTVVLLGGFVTSLEEKDFWCLTGISMVQAARIFNDSADNLFPVFLNLTGKLASKVFANPVEGLAKKLCQHPTGHATLIAVWVQVVIFVVQIASMLALVLVLIATVLYLFGPLACVVLSVWRLLQHDTAGEKSNANLVPALVIFYCLVICQGVFYLLWRLINGAETWVVVSVCEECRLPEEWGGIAVLDYVHDTAAKCWRDPRSGRKLIDYAADLVGSESQEDYLSGARILDTFIKLGADVRSLLLPSRPKVQKLIDTLGWRSSNRELRELAARIVAYLAGDIHLSQFPGAMRCISSLLDANQPYWNNHHLHSPSSISKDDTDVPKEMVISIIKRIEKHRAKTVRNQGGVIHRDGGIGSRGDGWNELILQGLTILERLALDQHNCSDMCSTPGLLPKIMAPLYSNTLIQDTNASAWADVANGSLKVVHRIIRAPGTSLAHDVSSSKQAVSNLENLLEQGNKELQMRAIEILTELAFDSSTNLGTETKENLIKKQLEIFLTDDEGEEEKLRVTAGKSLALLSKMKTISKFIMMEQNNIVDRLNEMLDANNNITYRTVALLVLENLCTHSVLDKDYVKEALLPKVLTEVMGGGKRDILKNNSAPEENQAISGPGNDEEKQLLSKHSGQINSPDEVNEERNAQMEFREALLSLTLVLYDQLLSADDFDDVARKVPLGEGEFVSKLKTIVGLNCEPTADRLRIVKLCGQLVVLVLKRSSQDTTLQFKECVQSLSRASGIMSNLESCMLFAGTDCGMKTTARPLLSNLAEEALKLVGN
ncbi:hypothetical protein VPH35_080263 [Triticum aestivum]|uniref:uncharacterized protein n=1 Tax=Triticum aestivum TaxID=4565 RepID=UPI001D01349B|nr:uncharacterized protein LOC123097164 [Triticum aestivum]